jgi:hypothetical protein
MMKFHFRRYISLALVVIVGIGGYEFWQDRQSRLPGISNSTLDALNAQLVDLPAYRVKIVKLAESQLGYTTNPVQSYCNKYSAYWFSGSSTCPAGLMSEEWCADFAAWVWKKSGVPVNYAYNNGDINASSASFYEWGELTDTWHPVGSGYVPIPGDVAIYGLNTAQLIAAHVAVVIGTSGPNHEPDAINGDGDNNSFSDVEFAANEIHPDVSNGGISLSGYVSPVP